MPKWSRIKVLTGVDKSISEGKALKKCGRMPLLADLALVIRVDPLAPIFGLREFVTPLYGTIVFPDKYVFPDKQVFPSKQVEAYRHSVLYVNFVTVAKSD